MNFDKISERRGTNSTKWDDLERYTGVSAPDGLAMWTADMDFFAPDFLQDAVRRQLEIANYGYFTGMDSYRDAVCWWMENRHGWKIEPEWMSQTAGLGNAIAIVLQSMTNPGDHVATFNPVYHEFEAKIRRAGRVPTQLPLVKVDGLFRMDFDAYDGLMTGREKILLISSPHNPAGRVWTRSELEDIANFCLKHDLILISDEIHHDLVFPGHVHVPAHVAVPQIEDRLIMMCAASKTFNIAGCRTGNVIIPDAKLRAVFNEYLERLDLRPNLFGIALTRSAYSPAGGAWVDELVRYIDGNQKIFNAGMQEIPGVSAMPMEGTYLAWIDFAGTGMDMSEIRQRVTKDARVGPTWGPTLGPGGETCLRINVGTQRSRVVEAVQRLQEAFADLQ
jgi:cystathionine beta-lyase